MRDTVSENCNPIFRGRLQSQQKQIFSCFACSTVCEVLCSRGWMNPFIVFVSLSLLALWWVFVLLISQDEPVAQAWPLYDREVLEMSVIHSKKASQKNIAGSGRSMEHLLLFLKSCLGEFICQYQCTPSVISGIVLFEEMTESAVWRVTLVVLCQCCLMLRRHWSMTKVRCVLYLIISLILYAFFQQRRGILVSVVLVMVQDVYKSSSYLRHTFVIPSSYLRHTFVILSLKPLKFSIERVHAFVGSVDVLWICSCCVVVLLMLGGRTGLHVMLQADGNIRGERMQDEGTSKEHQHAVIISIDNFLVFSDSMTKVWRRYDEGMDTF